MLEGNICVNTRVLLNIALNVWLMIVFVALNGWALQQQLEETFVLLALAYGCTVVIGNALYASWQNAP